MSSFAESRRKFLKTASLVGASALVNTTQALTKRGAAALAQETENASADYTLHIRNAAVEIGPKRIISLTTYNGQFPGPLLRLKEGRQVIVEVYNETDTPEQLHWHGQMVPADVDGASEEGTPFIPAHGKRRLVYTPRPAGFRFYHTHNRAGANLSAGQYGGEVGPVYIEPAHEPGRYDREVFLVLKEFEPTFSRGGDMPQDLLAPATTVRELKDSGEAAMKASLAKGMPKGYEVGYESFTINGRMLGHGEPIRVKQGERVLFHILNGSATEIRSLTLPGHVFKPIAFDGNAVPNPVAVPALWIGTAERISAVVKMDHPGVWVMGDLDDDDRRHGMGIVVEYAGRTGKPTWLAPRKHHWNYLDFVRADAAAHPPDETFEMTFAKDNAAEHGFNRWTINGVAYPITGAPMAPSLHLHEGKRYRLRLKNASDDIHPIHLHRHTFELTRWAGTSTAGIMKDVVMLGGYQEIEIDFAANNPGLTLFHCHQQLHMDFGFMTLFDYV
jgi:FtsP/CotA-like multicopper oxidase with cupredoxin domain